MSSYVRTLYEFRGEPGSTEMSITVGEVLTVTRVDVGDGWWEGRNARGEIGLFPAAYVEVMSATEVNQHQHQNAKQLMTEDYSTANRYDKTVDEYNDGDDWDDDWDDDNDTYSEIGPAQNSTKFPTNLAAQSTTNYDNQYMNALPVDDMHLSSMVPAANHNSNNSTTLKKSIMFGKSTDSYLLGLGNKDKIPDTDMVQIVHIDDSYNWQTNHESYTVIVASPKKETKFKGMKTYIAYQLTPSFNNLSVSRRYKHFDWLHERLVEKFCLIPIPPLPDKQISGRYEEQFVEHRRVQLQEFVDWVCRHPVLAKCEVWHHFLTCTDGKIWKSGKRKAERDPFVGIEYCWAISSPDKQLLQSNVDNQMDAFAHFIHAMDSSVRNLLSISSDVIKRYQSQSKKEFQRIGEGLSELSRALAIDEKRIALKHDTLLSESVANTSNIFINIGQQYGEQPKLDWIPFSDRLHIYRGILNTFPDILSTHKGAIQKRRDCERLAGEQKVSNTQMVEANKRTDTISYAILAEMTHFYNERETHLKQTLKSLIDEEIKFYSTIVAQLQTASKYFE